MSENPRLLELRRRVQADPASIAFAQLAEECRRAGDNDEAVGICRAGLAYHPDYLSARVTLGRALIELGRLDEAEGELTTVLAAAPDNLPANRALAEIFQQRGQLPEALAQYRRAMQLAQHDPEIEHALQRIERVVEPPPPPEPKVEASTSAIEDLFDFDTLLQQLGGRTKPKEENLAGVVFAAPVPSPIDRVELPADDADPFAVLERQLRDGDEQRGYRDAASDPVVIEDDERDRHAIEELEDWLAALAVDRRDHASL